MRASDFLSAPVLSPEGARLGVVIDIRTRPEPTGDGEIGLIVDGFIVGKRGWRLFGYERKREHGPLLLKWLVGLIHRNTRYARWEDVEPQPGESVRLTCSWESLPFLRDVH